MTGSSLEIDVGTSPIDESIEIVPRTLTLTLEDLDITLDETPSHISLERTQHA